MSICADLWGQPFKAAAGLLPGLAARKRGRSLERLTLQKGFHP